MSVTHNRNNAAIGVSIGTALAVCAVYGVNLWKAWKPGEDWVAINRLIIADTEVGGDPRIIYDRDLKADAPGTWSVNVFRHSDKNDTVGVLYCPGSGQATYKAGRPLPPDAIHLSWLMDRNCHFDRGTYRAVVTFIINPPGYPTKVVEKESNYFVVPPPKEESP